MEHYNNIVSKDTKFSIELVVTLDINSTEFEMQNR
jgi:hypothetical protein